MKTTGRRVHVYCPHPDDAEIFVGGTLLHHYHAGDSVRFSVLTRGGLGTKRRSRQGPPMEALRVREMERRVALLPGAELHWFSFEDGAVTATDEAVAEVAEEIDRAAPDIIYLPESTTARSWYLHTDHIATGRAVERAAAEAKPAVERRYYHTRAPNLFLDVHGHEGENEAALQCFASQRALTANPPLLLHRRGWMRSLVARPWPSRVPEMVRGVVHRLLPAANLPVQWGTEAFRVSS